MDTSAPGNSKKPSVLSRLLSLSVVVLTVVTTVYVMEHRQDLADFVTYHRYTPSAQVASLADKTAMSQHGRYLFYVSHPTIDGAQDFNRDCSEIENGSIVLGCYTQQKIYIYDVTNQELVGIKEVTAAHEMLHAAYDRLSSSERQRIDGLLQAQNELLKQDPVYVERLKVYDGSSQAELLNELHSIIGTEAPTISSELEQYYQQYFTSRQTVTELYRQYSGVFVTLQASADQLVAELDALAMSINQQTDQHNQAADALSRDIASFNTRADSGYYTSQPAFNRDRNALISRQQQLTRLEATINQQITSYDTKKAELDAIGTHLTTLNNSIDSNLAPAPAVQ